MIELRSDELIFSAPEVHPGARFAVSFQRTLRVPDDGLEYPLPAGLGRFALEHVDDHARRLPPSWVRHGGVLLPMHPTEAMWLSFDDHGYPWALKIAAGMVNAVSGGEWSTGLTAGESPSERRWTGSRPTPRRLQDYVVVSDQPWLDGFNAGDDTIRQFVAMPLGAGFTAEEQLTGEAQFGGIQLLAYPMKADVYQRQRREFPIARMAVAMDAGVVAGAPDMGLGAGGRIRQDIHRDRHGLDAWDLEHPARCFVHLARAEQWTALTGRPAPTRPPTPRDYLDAGIPWFDYATTSPAVPASDTLARVRSVREFAAQSGLELSDNDTVPVDRVVKLSNRPGVRSGPT